MTTGLCIGHIQFPSKVLLAPMAGFTDYPFRVLVRSFCPHCLVVSEMVAAQALIRYNARTLRMIQTAPYEYPLCVQISGSDPAIMSYAAEIAEDLGAAILDINMGCPQKNIVKTGAGAAIMRDETLAAKIIDQVVKSVKIPVTVKIRLGWDQEHINAPKIARIAQEKGASLVTVHARTRSQMFSGRADWTLIKKVVAKLSIPVIANGDIVSPEDAARCLELSGAQGVMIGRGAIGRPWLPSQIHTFLTKGRSLDEPDHKKKGEIAIRHLRLIIGYYGLRAGMQIAKRHLAPYTKGVRGSALFRKRLNETIDPVEMERLIKAFFNR